MFTFLSFFKVFSLVTGTAAALMNLVVIYLVYKCKNSTVGAYRLFLLSYIAMNLFCSVVTVVFHPIFSVNESSLVLYGAGLTGHQRVGSWFMVGFCFSLIGLITVLTVSYLYRYVAVCRPDRLDTFEEKGARIIAPIAMIFFVSFCRSYILCEFSSASDRNVVVHVALERPGKIRKWKVASGKQTEHGRTHSGMGEFRRELGMFQTNGKLERDFIIICIVRFIGVVVPIAVIAFCGISIMYSLNRQFLMMSTAGSKKQARLFVLLLLQTTCPLLFVYVPVSAAFFAALLRYKNFVMCDVFSVSVILAQLFDPLIVLCCVSDYRYAAIALIRRLSQTSSISDVNKSPEAAAYSTTDDPHSTS